MIPPAQSGPDCATIELKPRRSLSRIWAGPAANAGTAHRQRARTKPTANQPLPYRAIAFIANLLRKPHPIYHAGKAYRFMRQWRDSTTPASAKETMGPQRK